MNEAPRPRSARRRRLRIRPYPECLCRAGQRPARRRAIPSCSHPFSLDTVAALRSLFASYSPSLALPDPTRTNIAQRA